jgi:hypothetical protein
MVAKCTKGSLVPTMIWKHGSVEEDSQTIDLAKPIGTNDWIRWILETILET